MNAERVRDTGTQFVDEVDGIQEISGIRRERHVHIAQMRIPTLHARKLQVVRNKDSIRRTAKCEQVLKHPGCKTVAIARRCTAP